MPYRFNSVDILVGVGLCAIVFGAMILVVATSGAFLVSGSQSAAVDEVLPSTEAAWLQPALGRAIVERATLQQRTDQITAAASGHRNVRPNARSDARRHATSGPIPISKSSGSPNVCRKKLE